MEPINTDPTSLFETMSALLSSSRRGVLGAMHTLTRPAGEERKTSILPALLGGTAAGLTAALGAVPLSPLAFAVGTGLGQLVGESAGALEPFDVSDWKPDAGLFGSLAYGAALDPFTYAGVSAALASRSGQVAQRAKDLAKLQQAERAGKRLDALAETVRLTPTIAERDRMRHYDALQRAIKNDRTARYAAQDRKAARQMLEPVPFDPARSHILWISDRLGQEQGVLRNALRSMGLAGHENAHLVRTLDDAPLLGLTREELVQSVNQHLPPSQGFNDGVLTNALNTIDDVGRLVTPGDRDFVRLLVQLGAPEDFANRQAVQRWLREIPTGMMVSRGQGFMGIAPVQEGDLLRLMEYLRQGNMEVPSRSSVLADYLRRLRRSGVDDLP